MPRNEDYIIFPTLEATTHRELNKVGHNMSEYYDIHYGRETKCLKCGKTWFYNQKFLSANMNKCEVD